jgi:hypothetical protein
VSMSSRLDFDERRARALEGVVQYRPGAVAPLQPPTGGEARESRTNAEQAERRNRRRRRRGRRRPDDRMDGRSGEGGGAPRSEQSGDRGLTPAEEMPRREPETGDPTDRGQTPSEQSDGRGLTPGPREADGETSES